MDISHNVRGLKIDISEKTKDLKNEPRTLLICIHNYSLDKRVLKLIRKIPITINNFPHTKIKIIRSYPNIAITEIDHTNMYKPFNSLMLPTLRNKEDDEKLRTELLETLLTEIKTINTLIDATIITRFTYLGENFTTKLKEISELTNLSYFFTTDSIIYDSYTDFKTSKFRLNDFYDILSSFNERFTLNVNHDLDILCYNNDHFLKDEIHLIALNDEAKISIEIKDCDNIIETLNYDIKDIKNQQITINDKYKFYSLILIIGNLTSNDFKNNQDLFESLKNIYDDLKLKHTNDITNDLFEVSQKLLANLTSHEITNNLNKLDRKTNTFELLNNFVEKVSNQTNKSFVLDKIRLNIENNIKKLSDVNNKIQKIPEQLKNYELSNQLTKSKEFFTSYITLTDWHEEITSGNTLGLLIHIKTNDLTKLGINGIKPIISDISTTFIPTHDYIESILALYENELDMNNCIIGGTVIGKGNSVIPLFITKDHWSLARIHLEYILGIVLVNNPFGFIDSHLNFMFYLLAEMTKNLLIQQPNDNLIKTYLTVFRTCIELSHEKGYHKGIKKLITNLINDDKRITSSRPFDNDVLFGQILSTGSTIEDNILVTLCEKIFKNIFKRNIEKNYTKQYVEDVLNYVEDLDKELKDVINFVENKISVGIQIITTNFMMIKIFKNLIKKYGFMKIIKNMDDNFGLLDDDVFNDLKTLINDIKQPEITIEKMYEILGIKNDINDYCFVCLQNI